MKIPRRSFLKSLPAVPLAEMALLSQTALSSQVAAPKYFFRPGSAVTHYPPPKFHLGQIVRFDWAKNYPGDGDYIDLGEITGVCCQHPDVDYYHDRQLGPWTYLVVWLGQDVLDSSSYSILCSEFAHESQLESMEDVSDA